MSYAVKEIFKTLQGEGGQCGKVAVFCRFSGCNLWSGREEDRVMATCQFCDTDFVGIDGAGGGRFLDAAHLANALIECWGPNTDRRLVVFTGGEPLLQLDQALIDVMHRHNFATAVETNGTIAAPHAIDWICVSPKADTTIIQRHGQELKFIYPQADLSPSDFESMDFQYFWVQPRDGPRRAENTALAIAYCLEHPRWRVSLQTHKLMGIP